MKINYVIILITTYLSFLFSDINATTEDGKKIILFNNGTWQFENPAENAKFNLVEFVEARFEKHDKHYGREEKPYNAHIRGFFQFQNNSDQKIVAIKYQFSLIDAFGEVLYDSIVKDDIINHVVSYGFELWSFERGFVDPNTKQILQADVVFYKK